MTSTLSTLTQLYGRPLWSPPTPNRTNGLLTRPGPHDTITPKTPILQACSFLLLSQQKPTLPYLIRHSRSHSDLPAAPYEIGVSENAATVAMGLCVASTSKGDTKMKFHKSQDDRVHLILTADDCQRLAEICFAATAFPGVIIPPTILTTLFDLGAAFMALADEKDVTHDATTQPASQTPLAQDEE